MAFSSTAIHPVSKPATDKPADNSIAASLLGMLLLSVYTAQKSRKNFRKMNRKLMWTALKLKVKSLFSNKRVSDKILIYILLGVIALVLVFYYPLAALILAAVALILILAGVI